MKTTVSLYDFREAFRQYDRANSFSYDGYRVLFEYLEQLGDDIGEEIELDVIALCCEYDEGTPEDIADAYSYDLEGDDDDEKRDNLIDWLNDRTMVCGVTDDGLIVYQAF